jgi:ADP-ribose pyrophosphatase YjhB (NUDIX family)
MNLFVNDIPIRILKPGKQPHPGNFKHLIDAHKEAITKAKLVHHTWIDKCTIQHVDSILDLVDSHVPTDLLSLYLTVADYEGVKTYLKKKFTILKAAGGLMTKKEKFLLIHRLGKWDLPKGKKESGENYRKTAQREIKEECNISVKTGEKICTTWHTYTMNKKSMLKKTRWYLMDVVDDSKMRPEKKEDIDDLRWMNRKEVYHALENSYKSIRFVFEEYYRKKGTAKAKTFLK